MKTYYLTLLLLWSYTALVAQSRAEWPSEKSTGMGTFLARNREDAGSKTLLHTRFGFKPFVSVYDNISYAFETELLAMPFSGNILLPDRHYLNYIEVSGFQAHDKSNLIWDMLGVSYSWQGKAKQPGGIRIWNLFSGVGYQVRLQPNLWLRGMTYIGYTEIRQHLLRWTEDDERFDLEIRQGQITVRPEMSLVKALGKYAGANFSFNVGYDTGFFKRQSTRISDVVVETKKKFEEYNLQHNNQPISSIGLNPNRLVVSIGIGLLIFD